MIVFFYLVIMSFTCLMVHSEGETESNGCSENAKLTAEPPFAGMYGGRIIDLSGPCFPADKEAFCQFINPYDNEVLENTTAIYVNKSCVRCMVPRLLVRDRVILNVSKDNGKTFPYSTNLTIVFPGRMDSPDFVNISGLWLFPNASSLSLQWNNISLSINDSALVDIQLIGYKENDGKAMYKNLTTLGRNIPASDGKFKFNVNSHQCKGKDCNDFEVGLVEVRLQDKFTPRKYKFLTTNRVALGWYVNNTMTNKYGKEWPSNLCKKWYDEASTDMEWFDEIPKCPCSLAQAMADFGRWQPDTGCNLQKADNTSNCKYHSAAVHCVRSVQPVNGAGNQCCYTNKGYLVFAADTYFGSTADKSHDWGAAPYGKPGHVPILSHWVDDIIPLFSCCQWTDFKFCDYYVELRGTTDCTEYSPPVPASVYGLGHIATFGGQKIPIQTPGDYILLKTGDTELQARFDNNRILTGIAVINKERSDKVELRLHGLNHIEVLLNGKVTMFEGDLKWQDFRGVAVINKTVKDENSNFTVILTNNIGFQLAAVAGTLQLDLMMPTDTVETTSGLFGNIDGQKTLRNGTTYIMDVDIGYELFKTSLFAQEWTVKTNNLFSEKKTFSNNPPPVIPKNGSPQYSQSLCEVSQGNVLQDCELDYTRTGSRDIAIATKQAAIRHQSLAHNLVPIRSCVPLNIPYSKKSSDEYTIGTKTTITGCRTGTLSGTSTYTCIETSQKTLAWSPAVTAKCEVETTMETPSNEGTVAGVVITVMVVIAIALALVIVYVRKRRNKKCDGNNKEMAPMGTK